jgi:hypothetical protein
MVLVSTQRFLISNLSLFSLWSLFSTQNFLVSSLHMQVGSNLMFRVSKVSFLVMVSKVKVFGFWSHLEEAQKKIGFDFQAR